MSRTVAVARRPTYPRRIGIRPRTLGGRVDLDQIALAVHAGGLLTRVPVKSLGDAEQAHSTVCGSTADGMAGSMIGRELDR
jgi:hypothetical protein